MKILVLGDSTGMPRVFSKKHPRYPDIEVPFDTCFPERLRQIIQDTNPKEEVLVRDLCTRFYLSRQLGDHGFGESYFFEPDYIIICVGMVDCWNRKGISWAPYPDLIGKSPWINHSEFEEHLRSFVSQCFGSLKSLKGIIFRGINGCSASGYAQHAGCRRRSIEYNSIMRTIAKTSGVFYLDIFQPFTEKNELLASDGTHPSAAGQNIIAQKLFELIKKIHQADTAATALEEAPSLFSRNLKALQEHQPTAHKQVATHEFQKIGTISPYANNHQFHNISYKMNDNSELLAYRGDPAVDAEDSIRDIPADESGLLIIVGLALGYNALHIIQHLQDLSKIVIIEPSLDSFITALHHTDLAQLINNPKVHFFLGPLPLDQFKNTCEIFALSQDILIRKHLPSFEWRPDLYQKAFEDAYSILNKLQISGATSAQTAFDFFNNRFDALTLLHHTTPTDTLAGIFKDKPAVLVAAGPSLAQDLQQLKDRQNQCIIICADTALAVLLDAEITPDFVTSADYSMLSFEKTAPYMGQKLNVSLVTKPKTCPLVSKRLNPKHNFIAFNRDAGQNWIIDLFNIQHIFPPISSVAHLSLGLALLTEANPIIFLGQDLAYTNARTYHVQGTHLNNEGRQSQYEDDIAKPGVRNTTVFTDRSFIGMKDDFEAIIAKQSQQFINATSRGLRISGTQEMDLSEALPADKLQTLDIEEDIKQAINNHQQYPINKLPTKIKKTLKVITKAQKLLRQFLKKANDVGKEIAKQKRKTNPPSNQKELPGKIIRSLQEITTLNDTINSFRDIWDPLAELTFSLQNEIDLWQEKNRTVLQNKGYLAWLMEEMKRFKYGQKTRIEALLLFKTKLESLLSHLKKEIHLSNQQHKNINITDLAETYILSGDFVLAQNTLDTHTATEPRERQQKQKIQILQGAINAALFPDQENKIWHRILQEQQSQSVVRLIEKLARQIAAPWLKSYKKYGSNSYLATKCIKRLSKLIPFLGKKDLNELLDLWREEEKEINVLIQNDNGPKVAIRLNIWLPIENHLPPSYQALKTKNSLSQERQGAGSANTTEANKCDAKTLAAKARQLLESGDFEQGLETLTKAVHIDPNTATLWEEIGDLLITQNDLTGAINAYERCLEALPTRHATTKKLVEAHLQLGDVETAKSILEVAVNQGQQ